MKIKEENIAVAAEKILTNIWQPVVYSLISIGSIIGLFFITQETLVRAIPLGFCAFTFGILAFVTWITRRSVLKLKRKQELEGNISWRNPK